MREQLLEQARALGIEASVWFTGARRDVPELMRAMDVFVLPSMNEGISNTILEAMASGLPVVAARVGGNPELIRSGVSGVLYEDATPAGLVEAMSGYVRDPARRSSRRRGPYAVVKISASQRWFELSASVSRTDGRGELMCGITGIFDTRVAARSTGRCCGA